MSLLKGRKAISHHIGEDENRFLELVNKMDLPCWRTFEGGIWKAMTQHLDSWVLNLALERLGDKVTTLAAEIA